MDDLLPQAVGLLGSLFVIVAYAFKNDVTTKRITMGGSILFAFHFYLMGTYAAMGVTIVNIVRVWLSTVFHGKKSLCTFFVVVYIVVGITAFENPIDLFAISAPIIATIAMYCFSGIGFRGLCLVATTSWLIYGILIGSAGVVLTQVFVSSVNIVTIIRLMRDKKNG